MSITKSNPMQPQRFQLTQIKGPDEKQVMATIQSEEKGCVVKFYYKNKKPIMNYIKNRNSGDEEEKQFSVFIPKNNREVLRMLTNQKGKIVPHRKNPKQLFLCWDRVMVPTNFTLDGKIIKASFLTSEKKDENGPFWQVIFRFSTEDGKIITHNMRGQKKPFTVCFNTENQNEVTDKANSEWLLQEGQIVPHEKHEGSLFLRIGKAPVKTSFTIDVDGKTNQVYAHTRVHEKKDENEKSFFMMKIRFYSNERVIMHYNSKGKRVPFVYSYMTNNPEYVTSKAIDEWFKTTSGKILPHKKVEGKLFLLFEK